MKKFNRQIFTSFNLLLTFLIMLLSGIVLYFKPEGSVARQLDWQILGVDKSGWESLHTVFSFLFLLFALYHILEVHVKQIRAYVLNYKPGGFRRELYFSLLISILFLVGTLMYMPPFHTIYQAGNALSGQWAERVQVEHQKVEPSQSLEEVAGEPGMDTTAGNGRAHSNRIYRSITLEEMAVILGVPHAAIQDFLTEEYDLKQLSLAGNLYDISRSVNEHPRQVKSAILEHFQ